MRKSSKVRSAHVNLLNKWRFGVYDAAPLQDAMDFLYNTMRF
jgi:hypothetical protein